MALRATGLLGRGKFGRPYVVTVGVRSNERCNAGEAGDRLPVGMYSRPARSITRG